MLTAKTRRREAQKNKTAFPAQAGIWRVNDNEVPAFAGKARNKISSRLRAFAVIFLLTTTPALAQETMTEVERLRFGLFSLHDNDAAHTIVIDAGTNNFTADPAFVMAGPDPQRGEYLLENLPANTEVTVTINPGGLTPGGGAGADVFTIDGYTVSPSPVMTDGSGTATVYVGATLHTLGDAVIYSSDDYQGDLDITFSW